MNKHIQLWQKRLETSDKPAYLLLADLIAEDIRTGRLTARDKLPTLRDLAADLRLNYTTVARGYAEARKRGLIDSRAGTGTFIRGTSPALPLRGGGTAEMTMNLPPEPQDAALIDRMKDSASRLMADTDMYDLLRYQDFGGSVRDREAAMQWLRPRLPDCRLDQMLVCPGIHSVL
ncbi:MAG: GntR family transcriptional regulator, partial [Pseudomonadota bacterium]